MSPSTVLYNREAMPVCDACYRKADLLDTDRRAADNIKKAAYVCLGAGLVTLIAPMAYFGFHIAAVVIALTSGLYTLQSLARGNERFTKHLTPVQQQIVWGVTVGGMALAVLSLMGLNLEKMFLS
jgi:choline-glycine betaine transporter